MLQIIQSYRPGEMELAEIMEERPPLQLLAVFLRKPHLAADHVGVEPHAFAMAARVPVVISERGDEQHDLFGGQGGIVGEAVLGCFGDQSAHLPSVARTQGDAQARWRLVGEHE